MKIFVLTSGSVKSNFTYRALQLSRSLKKRGHEVTIVSPAADKYNNFVAEKISEIDGVKILQPFQFNTKRLELNLIPYIFHVIYLILRNKIDLVYIYKPTPITVVGLFAKFFYGTKVVLDMDDLGSEVMKIEGHPYYQIKLVEWCENIVAKYADKIVTASTYLKKHFESRYKDKPIIVISNAVDSEWFKPQVFSSYRNRIVFMGSINRKNILDPLFDVLPSIIKKVPDLRVVIMGDGKYLGYFKSKVSKLGLEGFVDFTGWLSIDEAQSKLLAGDIGYNYMPDEPTTRAASNMKVPQYMARGVVPFVSNVGDLSSYVEDGKAGYVCTPDNLSALEDGLILSILDKNRLEKSLEASMFSARSFSWDILAEKFETWFIDKGLEKVGPKKVYFVTISVPGNVGGGEIRNFHLLKKWADMENTLVKLFSISTKDLQKDVVNIKNQIGIDSFICAESNRNIFRTIKSVLIDRIPPFMNDFSGSGIGEDFRKQCEIELPDVVHLEQVHAYYCIRKHVPWLRSKGVKIILDCHNIEFKSFDESLDVFRLPKKIVGKFMVNTLRKLEHEALAFSDYVLCCSEIDFDFFKKYNQNTFVVPNGVDTKAFEYTRESFNKTIIFMGGVGYPPNEDAVKFYLNEVHPKVKESIPDVKFLVIGADQSWLSNNGYDDQSITALGFVPEVLPYLKEASLGICPIRYGSGTRLKILTYLASSLPVVSTKKGAEGVGYVNGRDIILEDEASNFAESVVKLLKDESLSKQIGDNGHDFVLRKFDWSVIGQDLAKIYKKI